MRANESSLRDFLSGTKQTFSIPVYQRNYDWDEEQCATLMNDIRNICETKKKHFIGTICFSECNDEYVIIDGQQRITSIMLVIKALHHITNNKNFKDNLFDYFLTYKDFTSSQHNSRVKLKPIEKDKNVFDKLIYQDTFDEFGFDEKQKRSTVYRNYIFFRKSLLKMLENGYTDKDIFDALDKLEIVKLKTEDENPQIIFEGLNSKGQSLTKADLIRNYILMPLTPELQKKMYIQYWLPMEEIFESAKDVETFILHYTVLKKRTDGTYVNGKKEKVNQKNLYQVFKKEYEGLTEKSIDEIEEVFKDILKYANIYRNFIFIDKECPIEHEKRQLFTIFNIFEKKDVAIFLMYIYNCINEGKINRELLPNILDAIVTFSFRSIICGKSGLSKQSSILSVQRFEKLMATSDDVIDALYRTLLSGNGSYEFPLNKDFRYALINNNIYESSKTNCKYLLHEIERYLNPKEYIPYENGSIEHICPQTLNKVWKEYLNAMDSYQDYEVFRHQLGNLTLTGYNSEISNFSFKDKKELYKTSNYTITKEVAKKEEWSKKEIDDRSKFLAKVCLEIWSLPEKYNNIIQNYSEVLYNMESDFQSLTNCKPNELIFCDKTFVLTNWIEMQKIIMEQLHMYDKYIFDDMVYEHPFNTRILISKTSTNMREDLREMVVFGDDVYFMYKNFSTSDVLRNIKEMLEYYDSVCKANLSDEIIFTIKPKDIPTVIQSQPQLQAQQQQIPYRSNQENVLPKSQAREQERFIQPITPITFYKGDKVLHKTLGYGEVVGLEEKYVSIKFQNHPDIKKFDKTCDKFMKI